MKLKITLICLMVAGALFGQDRTIPWLDTDRIEFSGTVTTTERDALTGFTDGQPTIIFNETLESFQWTDDEGNTWNALGSSGSSGDLVNDLSPELGADLDANTFSVKFDDATGIEDENGVPILTFTTTTDAVNGITFTGGITGTGSTIAATGTDTNIDVLVTGKGTGVVKANGSQVITMGAAEISTVTEKVTPVNGDFLLIEDSADSNAKKRIQIGNLPASGGGGGSGEVVFVIPSESGAFDGGGDVGGAQSMTYVFRAGPNATSTTLATIQGDDAMTYDFGSISELDTLIESEIDSGTVTLEFDDTRDFLYVVFSEAPEIGGVPVLSIEETDHDDRIANIGGGMSTTDLPVGSTTVSGIGEIATQAEVNTGTDDTRWVTPDTLANWTGGGSGKVAQFISSVIAVDGSTTATIPVDASTPQNTEGTQWDTITITPTNASSKLLIEFSAPADHSTLAWIVAGLWVDSTADALAVDAVHVAAGGRQNKIVLKAVVDAGSTSARTYKIRYGTNTGTVYFNRSSTIAGLFGDKLQTVFTVTEYLP